MPFTENNGIRLHWEEKGEGAPILLVMGHRYSAAMWHPLIPALSAAHRVIWFDNQGTGTSGASRDLTVPQMAQDALAVMDAAGAPRAHVFGVSLGGVIVLELAMQRPERAVSLILGCTGVKTADKPRAPAWMRVLYYLPSWVLKALTPNRGPKAGYGSAASPEAIAYDQQVLAKDRFSRAGVAAQAKAIADYATTTKAVAALKMPALVLHGDEDALVPFAWGVELAETLPNSRFVGLTGCDHNFIVADGERTQREVLNFLAEVDQG